MPVSLWYDGPYWNIRVHDEIPVAAGAHRTQRIQDTTQELARVFEGAIAEHPEDWHMLQAVFSADHDADRDRRREAEAALWNDREQRQ